MSYRRELRRSRAAAPREDTRRGRSSGPAGVERREPARQNQYFGHSEQQYFPVMTLATPETPSKLVQSALFVRMALSSPERSESHEFVMGVRAPPTQARRTSS